jgi:phosphoglycerol transferase
MFAAAQDEVERLSITGRPFSLTMVSLGGHMPHGFVSPVCRKDPAVMALPNQTLQAFYCTNLLTLRFVERLRKQDLLDNTVVVIQSDHLAMRNDVTRALEAHERRNLFMIIDRDLKPSQQDKPAAMFDAYPTILSALGYHLPEGRAGIGTSLLVDAPTLTGRLGLRDLDRSILADQTLRNHLWGVGS